MHAGMVYGVRAQTRSGKENAFVAFWYYRHPTNPSRSCGLVCSRTGCDDIHVAGEDAKVAGSCDFVPRELAKVCEHASGSVRTPKDVLHTDQ